MASVMASVGSNCCAGGSCAAPPPSAWATTGSSTSASTIARSSTISQPTAMRPLAVVTALRSSRAFSSTTVLATDRLRPSTSPLARLHPQASAKAVPSAVAITICPTAPGIARRRTARRSATEKCRPTPNIISMTPISASWPARPPSVRESGIALPTTTPATR